MISSRSDAMLLRASMFASAGAAAIHVGVAHEHISEWPLAGAFMLGSGLAQLAWIAWAYFSKSRTALLTAVAGNASIIALWITSRTVGLPIGPMRWKPEGIHSADILCAALELLVVAGALMLLKPKLPRNVRAMMIWAVEGAIASGIVSMHQPVRNRTTALATLACVATTSLVVHFRSALSVKPIVTLGRVHVLEAFEVPRASYVLDASSGIAIIARSDAA